MPHTESEVSRRPADYAQKVESQVDALRQRAGELGEQAREVAADATETMKQNPAITVAVAVGFAFALGALWKMRSSGRQSQVEALLARLPDLPSADRLKSYWR